MAGPLEASIFMSTPDAVYPSELAYKNILPQDDGSYKPKLRSISLCHHRFEVGNSWPRAAKAAAPVAGMLKPLIRVIMSPWIWGGQGLAEGCESGGASGGGTASRLHVILVKGVPECVEEVGIHLLLRRRYARVHRNLLIKAVHVGEVHAVRVIILPARRPPSSRRKYPPQHTRRAWDVRPAATGRGFEGHCPGLARRPVPHVTAETAPLHTPVAPLIADGVTLPVLSACESRSFPREPKQLR